MGLNWNFQRGRGIQTKKTFCERGMDIFWNNTTGSTYMYFLFLIFQPLILSLLDIEPMMGVLNGVVMELQDCAFPLLQGMYHKHLKCI